MQKLKEAIMSSKCQITIPKTIREILHVDKGDSIVFYVEGNEVLLTNNNNINLGLKNNNLKAIIKGGE